MLGLQARQVARLIITCSMPVFVINGPGPTPYPSKNRAETLTYKTPGASPKPAQVTFINSTPRSAIFSLFHRALSGEGVRSTVFYFTSLLSSGSHLYLDLHRVDLTWRITTPPGGLTADLKATKKRDFPVC